MKKYPTFIVLLLVIQLAAIAQTGDFARRMERLLVCLEEREQIDPWEKSDVLFEINELVMQELVELLVNPLAANYFPALSQHLYISHSNDSVLAIFTLYENHNGTCQCCINVVRYRLPNNQWGAAYMMREGENYNCHSDGIFTLHTKKGKKYLSHSQTRTCSTCITEQILLFEVDGNGFFAIQKITIDYRLDANWAEDVLLKFDPKTQTIQASYKLGDWDYQGPCDWKTDPTDTTLKWCHFEEIYSFDEDSFVVVSPVSK